jgi:hypothetical protein
MKAVILALVCSLALTQAATSDAVNFYALLKGVAPIADTGVCVFRYSTSTKILYSHCEHTISSPVATAAHIHGPTDDAAGTGTADPYVVFPAPGNVVATSFVDTTATALTAAQELNLFDGKSYVNIHTAAEAAGRIRGQIVAAATTYVAELDTAQAGKTGNGRGIAWLTREAGTPATITIGWHYWGNPALNVTAVHLHGAADGAVGASSGVISPPGVICSGSACTAQWKAAGLADTPADGWTWVTEGKTYFNFHTSKEPAGEIRGQLRALVAIAKPSAASSLSVGVSALAAAIVLAFVAQRV